MSGGRVDPAVAWRAASGAVLLVTGAPPPVSAGVLRGGERSERSAAWRRQLAIYTAAVSLNVGVKPLVAHVGVSRAMVRKILRELEDRRGEVGVDELLELLGREASRRMELAA